MASSGWYPDPGGSPGLFRFWDGTSWTAITTTDPADSHPAAGTDRPAKKGRLAHGLFVIGLAALVLVVSAGIYLRLHQPATVAGWDDSKPIGSPSPSSPSPTRDLTPAEPSGGRPAECDAAKPDQLGRPAADGRVYGGPLSFQQLSAPWSSPASTGRFPFSRDSHVQVLLLPEKLPWQASAQVGVAAFDNYPGRTQAAQIMVRCLMTSDFYASVRVELDHNTATETMIGGTPATRVDARLTFSHPDLTTKGSLIRIIVVDTTPATYYFHAVPQERDDLIAALDQTTASLAVG